MDTTTAIMAAGGAIIVVVIVLQLHRKRRRFAGKSEWISGPIHAESGTAPARLPPRDCAIRRS
jgi:hypothetical protein